MVLREEIAHIVSATSSLGTMLALGEHLAMSVITGVLVYIITRALDVIIKAKK